jgi:hypothetical protein
LRILALIFLLAAAKGSFAQYNEVGGGIGAFNYAGDLMRGYHVTNTKPGIVAFYRRNFDNIFSFRSSITAGIISGNDDNPIDQFAALRGGSFQLTVVELGGMLEFNFLDFKKDPRRIRWSPYMMVGLSGFAIAGGDFDLKGSSPLQVALPFGGGFKYAINRKVTLNIEVGIRKLFFDHLDGFLRC